MKTLIVYAGKYGCTKDCVNQLKSKLNADVTIADAKDKTPDVDEYDSVIIGGSIYMGQMDKKLKEFVSKNTDKLLSKQLGLFVTCGFAEKQQENIDNSFPKALIEHANSIQCFGGEIRKDNLGFFHKKIIAMLEKEVDIKQIKLLPDNINKMAEAFNV